MNLIKNIPGLKDVIIKIHDYHLQKVNQLKWFELLNVLFYKRCRYVCRCGNRFSEEFSFVDRYQLYSKEWNQVARIRSANLNL